MSLELDRHSIVRDDFASSRKGYDRDEVDRHLREIADVVEKAGAPGGESAASAAAERVRSIVEAAERSASDIESRARADAERTRAGAQDAADRVLQRIDGVESDLERLVQEMRRGIEALVEQLRGVAGSLESDLSEIRSGLADIRNAGVTGGAAVPGDADVAGAVGAEPPAAGPPDAEPAVVEEVQETASEAAYQAVPATDAVEADEVVAEESLEPPGSPAGGGEAAAGEPGEGAEGARLIALNMALNGTPREETERYLRENFDLSDEAAILDEVYARVGG